MAPCVVVGCKTGYGRKHEKLRSFHFPKEQKMKEKWLCQISRKDFIPTRFSVVCEKHFLPEAFAFKDGRGRKYAKKTFVKVGLSNFVTLGRM